MTYAMAGPFVFETPVTKRQLRRLALQTSRYPSWRPVLQDALLEMYPEEFGRAIDEAERWAFDDRVPYVVFFRPEQMTRGTLRYERFRLRRYRSRAARTTLFAVVRPQPDDDERILTDRELVYRPYPLPREELVLVYVADPTRSR